MAMFLASPPVGGLRRWSRLVTVCAVASVALGQRASAAPMPHAPPPGAAGQFEEPLVATVSTTAADDAALLRTIVAYRAQAAKDDLTVFDRFLQQNPASGWRVALLADMGLLDYHYGYFSRALAAWTLSWQAGRDSTDPQVKRLVDRVAGELLLMHARLGHADEIEALLADIGTRDLTGPATQAMVGAKEGLWMMRNTPGVAYLCGPMALKSLLLTLGRPASDVSFIDDYRSGPRGTSLAEVAGLAERAKLAYRLVHRDVGQPVPIPSVVHWKLGHFAAIVGERDGRYHVQDPTFGRDTWVARGALDTETSGYYLAAGPQNFTPWRAVPQAEAARIRGMGTTGMNDPTQTTPYAPCDCGGTNNASGSSAGNEANSGSGDSGGMTRYAFSEMLGSLRLQDKPVGYEPGMGPAVPITLTYNQAEASQPANFSFYNVSPHWTMNWLAYVRDDPTMIGANVSRIVGGGGSITESFNSASATFTAEEATGATLAYTAGATPSYTLTFPDGSSNVYAVSNGATTYPRLVFISKLTDRYGNALTFSYDSMNRLTAIKDATARSTTFAYANTLFPYQVTTVTDPFKRKATFTYDASGRLSQTTDVLGLASKYAYDANSNVNALTTPYGTTNFSFGFINGNANSLFIQATDPLGYTERVEYVQGAPNVPFSDPSSTVPVGIVAPFNEYLSSRDTYYWDKHAQAVAPENYLMARQRHWAHLTSNTNITSGLIESVKYPFENRIWFNYPGQPNGGLGTAQTGSLDSPSIVGRVLDDGTTQLNQYQYNSLGNPTGTIDAVGRQTTITYASNNIDVLSMQQKTSSSGTATLAQYGGYSKSHLPATFTDAAGKTYQLAYNAAGQLTQQTDPLKNTVKYAYDANGNLITVTDQNGAAALTYTRDSIGHIAKVTDSQGWAVSYTYDAMDRITLQTFPDKTTRSFTYTNLDLTSMTDRQKRTTVFVYDANRNLTSMTDPAGNKTQFTYWENDKLKTLTDGNGHVTNWAYDVEGRPTTKTYADGSVTTTAYATTSSRIASVTDPLGQIKRYTYALDDQLSGISYQNAVNPTPSVSPSYDPYFARVTTMTDGTGTTQFAYVAPGQAGALQLAQEAGPQHDGNVTYRYDALGRVFLRKVAGNPDTYSYDPAGRLIGHADDLGNFKLSYLGGTQQVTAISGAGLSTTQTFDTNANDRRVLSIGSGANARTFAYKTTAENDISGITETLGSSSQSWSNSYDAADRLLTASLSTGSSFAYTYDKAGNITAIQTTAGTSSIAYTALNQATAFNGKHFTYDANGNLTQDDLRTYSYDAENRLVEIGLTAQPGVSESFRYDGRNHRVAQIAINGAVTTETHYFWCGETLCQQRNARDKVIKRYFAEGEEAPAAGTSVYYGSDQNGSVRDLISAQTGALVGTNDFDPYGNAIASTGSATTDFRYAGLVTDGVSGLQLATHRFYDPRLGRFVNRDPIMEAGGINLYGYAGGNPISFNDPTGDCPWCIGAAIGFGSDLVTQLITNGGNLRCVNLGELAASTALGAVGAGIGGKALTGFLGGLSNATKGVIGESLSLVENRLAGSTLVSTQTASIPGFSTIVDSTWRSFGGAIYYVESKFGTSGLTAAQRLAANALGDAYQVERWSYPFFGRVGGYAGGTAGALLGSQGGANGGCGC